MTTELWTCIKYLDQNQAISVNGYWFGDDEGNDDEYDYCWACIHKIKPDAEIGEDFFGGSYAPESDSSKHCHRCGIILHYVLTDCGINEELTHFDEFPFDWNNTEDCHCLARVAHGLVDKKQHRALATILSKGINRPDSITLPII